MFGPVRPRKRTSGPLTSVRMRTPSPPEAIRPLRFSLIRSKTSLWSNRLKMFGLIPNRAHSDDQNRWLVLLI